MYASQNPTYWIIKGGSTVYPRYVQNDIHLHSVVHHDPTKEGVKIDKQVKVLAFRLLGVCHGKHVATHHVNSGNCERWINDNPLALIRYGNE